MSLLEITHDLGQDFWDGIRAAERYMEGDLFSPERWFIVGGYVRDHLTQRQFKDIDIFIPGSAPIGPDAEELEYDLAHNSVGIFEGYEINRINLMGAHTMGSLLERCDVGLCQVGYDPMDEKVYATKAFATDLLNETLTVTRVSRRNHIDRVVEKFPSYTLIDPYKGQHSGDQHVTLHDFGRRD